MKILHVINSMEIGGAQRLLSELLPFQSEKEDVTLLVFKRLNNEFEKKIIEAGIPIISLDENNFYNPAIIIRMRRILRNFSIIHVHLFPSLYLAATAAVGLDVKLVYTEHSTSNSRRNKPVLRPIERYIYRRYSRIISISQQTQEALAAWIGEDSGRFVVINNGVNLQCFTSQTKPVIPDSIIMVSRFAPSKDQETLIRALTRLDTRVILRLVGDGETLGRCMLLAIEEGVSDRIEFLGSRQDIPELVAESYIGVQSSNWEGFGLTAVELMAAGKPVIASDVDGLKQIVEGAGEIFHKGNFEELAHKISRLLDNKDYYNIVAQKCKERSKLYDINKMAQSYINLYYELQ